MQVQTLLSIGAVPISHEEVAFWHLSQVILMQELAVLALLAQATKPVLAHQRIQPPRRLLLLLLCRRRGPPVGDMPLCTARAVGAVSGLKGFAYGAIGWEADLVGFA